MNAAITLTGAGITAGSVLLGLIVLYWLLGLMLIDEPRVGIVVKRFPSESLAPGRLVALPGEAGYPADAQVRVGKSAARHFANRAVAHPWGGPWAHRCHRWPNATRSATVATA